MKQKSAKLKLLYFKFKIKIKIKNAKSKCDILSVKVTFLYDHEIAGKLKYAGDNNNLKKPVAAYMYTCM